MLSKNWLNYQILTDLLREEADYNDLTYKEYGTSRINNDNKSGIKQSDFYVITCMQIRQFKTL